jgi:hypothetical protein
MARFVVGTKGDFEESGTGKLVEVGGQSIAIFNVEGATTPSKISVLIEVDRCQRAR